MTTTRVDMLIEIIVNEDKKKQKHRPWESIVKLNIEQRNFDNNTNMANNNNINNGVMMIIHNNSNNHNKDKGEM